MKSILFISCCMILIACKLEARNDLGSFHLFNKEAKNAIHKGCGVLNTSPAQGSWKTVINLKQVCISEFARCYSDPGSVYIIFECLEDEAFIFNFILFITDRPVTPFELPGQKIKNSYLVFHLKRSIPDRAPPHS